MSDAGGVLWVAGSGFSKGFVGSQAVEKIAAATSTRLVFHRYGNRYFLYQIWVEGENRGRELPRTRLEKEVASNARPSSVAVLASKWVAITDVSTTRFAPQVESTPQPCGHPSTLWLAL